jgi:hypothetical protein
MGISIFTLIKLLKTPAAPLFMDDECDDPPSTYGEIQPCRPKNHRWPPGCRRKRGRARRFVAARMVPGHSRDWMLRHAFGKRGGL